MRVTKAANFQSNVQLFHGVHQVYLHPKYGWIVGKWPRKRGPAKTPLAAENQAQFAQVVAWCKQPMSADVEVAQSVTKGTGYLPRDLMESACYGLVCIAYTQDGRILYGRRMLTENAQALLDTITTVTGAMLVRTADGWIGLVPAMAGYVLTDNGPGAVPTYQAPALTPPDGTAQLDTITTTEGDLVVRGASAWIGLGPSTLDYVLTSNGPGNVPSFQPAYVTPPDGTAQLDTITTTEGDIVARGASAWQALAPGTVAYVLTSNGPGVLPSFQAVPTPPPAGPAIYTGVSPGESASAYYGAVASVGNIFTVDDAITLTAVWALLTPPASAAYLATIATMNSTGTIQTIVAVLETGTLAYSGSTNTRWIRVALAAAVTLSPGTNYGVFITRTDALSSTAIVVFGSTDNYSKPIFPGNIISSALEPTLLPASGTTFNVTGQSNYASCVGFEYHY